MVMRRLDLAVVRVDDIPYREADHAVRRFEDGRFGLVCQPAHNLAATHLPRRWATVFAW